MKTEETETESAEENVMLGKVGVRVLSAGTLRALRYCASHHASGSGRRVMRVFRVIFALLPPCSWNRYAHYRRSARFVCCPHSTTTPQKKMMAVRTDFDSPVTRPTPGSTESAASKPDADEAVERTVSQPHPVAPASGSPMPAPLTQQPPH